MIENGTLLQDRYLIEKKIGAGGMGAVYLAVDRRFENYVAIKETFYTDDEFGEAFEREARLLNGLHHPVLPHVSDYFSENNKHFLVMQYIEGDDLSVILKRAGAFPLKTVLLWLNQLLDALDYLHSQEPPVIHRDIKPQNLKITPRGDIILLDFGLAKLKSEDTSNAQSVFGYSKKYSPLEQIQGTGTDARSDIFSLGATAYHLLTGKPPIDVLARASEIVVGNPDPLKPASEVNSDVSVRIANILNSALALNPAARFVSAKAMQQALEHAGEVNLEESVEIRQEPETEEILLAERVVHSPEAEDFPALEAFAADAVKNEPQAGEEQKTEVKDSAAAVPIFPQEFKTLPKIADPAETPTRVAAVPRKKSAFPIAAVVALMIFAGLAAGYFVNRTKSSTAAKQNSAVQKTPEINPVETQTASSQNDEVPNEAQNSKKIEKAETKPAVIEKTSQRIEKNDPGETPEKETVEKTVNESDQNEVKRRSAPVQTAKRREPVRQKQSEPKVVESQSLPDIESIFTGRPNPDYEKIRRRERRKQREEMTDEEWREMRKQQRKERKKQNNRPLPF